MRLGLVISLCTGHLAAVAADLVQPFLSQVALDLEFSVTTNRFLPALLGSASSVCVTVTLMRCKSQFLRPATMMIVMADAGAQRSQCQLFRIHAGAATTYRCFHIGDSSVRAVIDRLLVLEARESMIRLLFSYAATFVGLGNRQKGLKRVKMCGAPLVERNAAAWAPAENGRRSKGLASGADYFVCFF